MWHRCKNNCAFLPSRLARALWIEIKRLTPARVPSAVESRDSLVNLSFTGGIYFFIDLVNKIA